MTDPVTDTFEDRQAQVEARIQQACDSCGRSRADVELVAVSKRHPPESIDQLAGLGQIVFGENKVQEAKHKVGVCSGHLEWHLIGHLQSNKARHAAQLFHTIHSVDSSKLLELLNQEAGRIGKTLKVYLQVNVSGERSKSGMSETDVPGVLELASDCMNLDVIGLMTMPPISEDPEDAAPFFARLRSLRDEMRVVSGFPLDGLSMGMSHDFEVAIREGSTSIRVGTNLFGKRPPV